MSEYTDTDQQMESKLILCLSNVKANHTFDTCLFIGWDTDSKDYFIRGRRHDTDTKNPTNNVPYAFHCNSTHDLVDFIYCIMNRDEVTFSLFNYNNTFSRQIDVDLTFEFFEKYLDSNYLLSRSKHKMNRHNRMRVVEMLRMLKNLYNYTCDGEGAEDEQ
jgi:hypothetical protein